MRRIKFCFKFCEERCDCGAAEELTLAMLQSAQHELDVAASKRITDRGGIDGTVRPSQRIGP